MFLSLGQQNILNKHTENVNLKLMSFALNLHSLDEDCRDPFSNSTNIRSDGDPKIAFRSEINSIGITHYEKGYGRTAERQK